MSTARPSSGDRRPAVVWFRDDLRVADNPALDAAARSGRPVVCVYLWDDVTPGLRPPGGAARWWLHHSLDALDAELRERGAGLLVRRGATETELAALTAEVDAAALFWNRRYGGAERTIDTAVKSAAREAGIDVQSFGANLLFEPWTVRTGAGTAYSVFTPFWRACLSAPPPRRPLPAPEELRAAGIPDGLRIDELALLPRRPDWAGGLRDAWEPGEQAAHDDLGAFVSHGLARYRQDRDDPAIDATSRLSPRLRWGELSPHQVWQAASAARDRDDGIADGTAVFLSELGWREFAYHTLFEHPQLATVNIRREYDAFPWPRVHPTALRAWKRGRTGIPLVDAGMRELWTTGTMHNRVRMVTASFLTKNLLIDWRHGEQWFWDTLVDADPASNPFNWQWVAGSGADAAPYFRVFNPELQRTKFDPHGDYVRRWAPDWDDADYPDPLVDLGETRRAALAAYETVRRSAQRA